MPLNLLSQAAQLAYVLGHSGVRCVFVSAEYEATTLAVAIALLGSEAVGGTPPDIVVLRIDVDTPLRRSYPQRHRVRRSQPPRRTGPRC